MILVNAEELQYIDRTAGHDKFYRVFQWGSTFVIQYGRNGTYGVFKRTTCADEGAAVAGATKQRKAKFSKGYECVKNALLSFSEEPTDAQLDTAMARADGTDGSDIDHHADARERAVARMDDFAPAAIDRDVLERVRAILADDPLAQSPLTPEQALRPMLAEPATDVDDLLQDDEFLAQYKLDGDRFVIEVNEGVVAAYNRQGQPKTSNMAPEVLAPFYHLTEGYWVFDGEMVGRTLWLFDMAAAWGRLPKNAPFVERYNMMAGVLTGMKLPECVRILPCSQGLEDKQFLLQHAVEEEREGVIFRRMSGSYQFGRRTKDLQKYKFLKEADVFVTQVGVKSKENAEVAVYNSGLEQVVGMVSTIGKGDVAVGDVLEVRFLYVLDPEFPRMFQPRILRKRTDKSAEECSIDQFKNAGTNKEI